MKALSLFANVGIGETYFHEVGIEVVVANELEKDRAEFYQELYPESKMIHGSIVDSEVYETVIREAKEQNVELIFATPPCQGMSIAFAKRAEKNDPRNSLIKRVVAVTLELNPRYVLIENVAGMASEKTFILDDSGNQTNIMPYIESELGDKYEVRYEVLDAADFQTPHYRKRLITLLSRKDCEVWEHPAPNENHITVRDVIGDYPSLESGQTSDIKWHSMEHKIHNYRHKWWMQHTPTGKSAFDNAVWAPCVGDEIEVDGKLMPIPRIIKGFNTTYKRIDWDRPAPTVTMTNGSINSQNNCHPGTKKEDGTYSDARVLTIKELLAIVGLPLDWVDHLEHTQKRENFLRKVIGECFPPRMSLNIVKTIPTKKYLDIE